MQPTPCLAPIAFFFPLFSLRLCCFAALRDEEQERIQILRHSLNLPSCSILNEPFLLPAPDFRVPLIYLLPSDSIPPPIPITIIKNSPTP
ncbi:hypothetical protein PAPYR_8843 [Paratrimastix pyriformis]|uniref:Secreted protein n=1 Tax=Paratrimastix pyriformis TaxID=342808 RepID=A0ABQ8UEH3_9EUKA|nr:hypothetical protein PAPYR_8843 [Paratrimastix pyriformis]